jgi:hypothetical protein
VRTALTVAVLLGLLALSVGVAIWAWQEIGDVEMSWHGVIALGLGVAVTILLGAGLMALVFFSSRRGYDARAHQGDDEPPPDERAEPPGQPPQPR